MNFVEHFYHHHLITKKFAIHFGCVAVLFCYSFIVEANPEAPGMYDARNHGMGGAGVAYLSSPSAALHNPANLDAVKSWQFQADVSALVVNFTASFSGPGNEQETGWVPVPLPFIGYNQRISETITLGASFYVAVGFGGGFDDVTQYGTGHECTYSVDTVIDSSAPGNFLIIADSINNDFCLEEGREEFVQLAVMEFAFPLSYRVSDRLRVGASVRLPFGIFKQKTSQDIIGAFGDSSNPLGSFGLGMAQLTSDMFGYGNPGVLLGVSYDVTPFFTVAATYRSKITVNFSGDTSIDLGSNLLIDAILDPTATLPIGLLAGMLENIEELDSLVVLLNGDNVMSFAERIATNIDSETQWHIPKAIELGFALQLSSKVMLAVDWRHQYHSEVNKELIVILNDPLFVAAGLAGLGQTLNWKDVYGWSAGVEYSLRPNMQLRLGYSAGNSATPVEYTNQFTPPPGDEQSSFYAGLGYETERWKYDYGFSYGVVGNEIEQPYDSNGLPIPTATCQPGQLVKSGCPGEQEITSLFFSMSGQLKF